MLDKVLCKYAETKFVPCSFFVQISRKGIDPSAKNVLVATDIATNDERLICKFIMYM